MSIKINKYKFWVVFIVLLGIYLRLNAYLANPSLWHDECALALNIQNKSYSQLFGVLDFVQVAPPFFTVLTKFLTQIFGYSELMFRFIPFLVGCLSVVGFYFLSEKTLKSKIAVLLSTLFFALNDILINYSIEFKPYELDVFFTIICLLFFIDFKIEKFSLRTLVMFGFGLALIPWFSFAPLFVLGACFLNLFVRNHKENLLKKLALFLPVAVSIALYLIVYVSSNYTQSSMVQSWEVHNAFMTFNFVHNFELLVNVLKSLFFPINYILFFVILFFWGLFEFGKTNPRVFWLFLVVLISPIIASFLELYPYSARLVMFLVPIYLLCITKPLGPIDARYKAKSAVIILLLLSMFSQLLMAYKYSNKAYITKLEYPREMIEYIAKHSQKIDKIFVNNASNVEFLYYNSIYKLPNEVVIENSAHYSKMDIIKFVGGLEKGTYWFYFPWNLMSPSELQELSKIPRVRILYKYAKDRSILLYLEVK